MDYKLETYLKIARLYLEDDDPVQGEAYINRASILQVCGGPECDSFYLMGCFLSFSLKLLLLSFVML